MSVMFYVCSYIAKMQKKKEVDASLRAHESCAGVHLLRNTCWGQEDAGCPGVLSAHSSGSAGIILMFNSFQDSLCVALNHTAATRGI